MQSPSLSLHLPIFYIPHTPFGFRWNSFQKRLQQVGGSNVRIVPLTRNAKGFGIGLEMDESDIVVVTRLVPGSVAEASGQFKKGQSLTTSLLTVDKRLESGVIVQEWLCLGSNGKHVAAICNG